MEKEEFLKILPKLIVEDNEVKGAIITALSGIVATKKDINKLLEHSDRRFEKMDQRFEKMDQRFEKMDQRFEKMDQRFEKMDEKFNKIHEILLSHTQALTQLNNRTNNLNANFSRINNTRSTEFKTLDGKIELLSKGQAEIKEILSKKDKS
ncbi:MAG: hypothetical protein ACTSR8_15985 [Promethearchaeota archaeon]